MMTVILTNYNCNSFWLNYLCVIYSGGTANYTPAPLLKKNKKIFATVPAVMNEAVPSSFQNKGVK